MKLKTRTEFIQEAQGVHGLKYDYSEAVYSGGRVKLTIICPEHGSFEQTPTAHLNSHGCLKCYSCSRIKKTLTEFVQEAQGVHGLKYDYSEAVYKGVDVKLNIICTEHGPFHQTPASHVKNKSGCPRCYGNAKKTLPEFIKEAQSVHGTKYDYSKAIYSGNMGKLTIICPEHGPFQQTPASHVKNKSGCPRCYKNRPKQHLSTDEFVEKLKCIHSNMLIYDDVVYTGADCSVNITCKQHGKFKRTAKNLIQGLGCKRCAKERVLSKVTKTTEEFLAECEALNTGYDYSLAKYTRCQNKVKIICPTHGVFEQTPNQHLSKRSKCPKCFDEIRSNCYIGRYTLNEKLGSKIGIFYVVEFNYEKSNDFRAFSFIKVGITSKTIKERYSRSKRGGKNDEKLSYKVHLDLKMSNLSTALLERSFFKEHPPDFIFPEGFKFGGKTECYKIENFNFNWLKGLEFLK